MKEVNEEPPLGFSTNSVSLVVPKIYQKSLRNPILGTPIPKILVQVSTRKYRSCKKESQFDGSACEAWGCATEECEKQIRCLLMRFVQSGHPWNQGINDFGEWFAPLVFVLLFQLMDIH